MPIHHRLNVIALLFAAATVLAGCATRGDAPTGVAASDAGRPEQAEPSKLSPAQALSAQAQGMRVRWSGGINAIDRREGGRQCFTLLQATFDAQQILQWPSDEQMFVACGPGEYDPTLVAQFTLISLVGRVTGQQLLFGKPVPVIEIDTLFRHSDCAQGDETLPVCYSGLLQPQRR